MEGPAARLGAGFALGAAILAGCASPTPPAPVEISTSVPTYTGPPIVLKAAEHAMGSTGPATGAANPAAHSTEHSAVRPAVHPSSAVDYFNEKRAEVGLPPMAYDANIAAAASAHAHYLVINGASGHDEAESAPGFTGIDATARVRRHTDVYGASEVLSVFGNGATAQEALEQIFASPYHRGASFFDWVRAGAAAESANRSVTVVDFADIGHALADNELIAYPYNGQSDSPVAWTDNEVPDPLGPGSTSRGRDVGYPITLSGGPTAHIELRTLDLRDAKGHTIACRIAPITPADHGRNTAICTPFEPLAYGMQYTVHATGTLTQATRFAHAPFTLDWHFSTRASDSALRVAGQTAGTHGAD